jgi:hypothetical protein
VIIELDDKRLTVDTGPGENDAALDLVADCMRERERTRRFLLLAVVAAFPIVAAVLVVFAPSERQGLAQWIGVALLALALGAAGYSRFSLKTPFLRLKTGGEDAS